TKRWLAVCGVLGCLVSGCSGPQTGSDPPQDTPPNLETPDEIVTPADSVVWLAESWPLETDLDHAAIPDATEVWVDLVDSAQTSLWFEEFYGATAPDSALEPVISAVERAAARGVDVRFVFDQ